MTDPANLVDHETPQAHSLRITWCGGPGCDRPHVVLLNEAGRAIAQFVVPDRREDGGCFVEDLAVAFLQGEMLRGVR